jgi:hypothetical protein
VDGMVDIEGVTRIEGRNIPLILLPEVLPLVQAPLRGAAVFDVGVLGIRHGVQYHYQLRRKCNSRWEEQLVSTMANEQII